jgi:hypothetical protein
MRTRALTFVAVMTFGVVAVPVTAGGATPASQPRISQPLFGNAGGTFSYSVYTGDGSEQGTYQSTGQLGSGTYLLTTSTATGTGCNPSDGPKVTARFVRSDGAVLQGTQTSDIECGAGAGPHYITLTLTKGTRDLAGARLVFRRTASNLSISPSGGSGTEQFVFTGTVVTTQRVGYWMLGATGTVYGFGGLAPLGNAPSTTTSVHLEPTPARDGYWIVDRAGRVYAFGAAVRFINDRMGLPPGEQAVSLSATPNGRGYWIFTARGRVVPFGEAKFFGDLRSTSLQGPIVGSVATPSGNGYYLVGSDGGVFAFGDARFRGSMGATRLDQPVNGVVPTADGSGYWLVASDGGVFAFGAPFLGSMGGTPLNRPVVGMVRYGTGYLMVATDGGIFSFSTQPFFGSLAAFPPANPIVSAAAGG